MGVSSCLIGEPVRFNGGHRRDDFLTGVLAPYVEWVPVCPEVEVGMGTPQETLRLVDADDGPAMVAPATGRDHTRDMRAFAARRVRELDELGLSGYVLKSKSPSCGLFDLPVFEGERVRHRYRRGLFASALTAALPLLAVAEECRLTDSAARRNFVERLFAHTRLRELFEAPWRQHHLRDFHRRHEVQLMAHDPARAAAAGQVVAAADARPSGETEDAYTRAFLRALAVPSTLDTHLAALRHALDRVGSDLDDSQRRDVRSALTACGRGRAPLDAPTSALRHLAPAGITSHTYFDPFPAPLRSDD